MKSKFYILPVISLFVVAIGFIFDKVFPDSSALLLSGILFTIMIGAWFVLDRQNFIRQLYKKSLKYGLASIAYGILGAAVIISIAYVSNQPRFNKTFDATKENLNTLSQQSMKLISNMKDLESPIRIKGFFTNPEQKQVFQDLIKMFQAQNAEFDLSYHIPMDEPVLAKQYELTSPDSVIISSANGETRITSFTEEKLTNAFVNVLRKSNKTIYFVTGHGEANLNSEDIGGLKFFSSELQKNKIDIKPLQLMETGKVPQDASALIIASPKYDLKVEEVAILDAYLKKGGALLTMINSMVITDNFNDLLTSYGIRYDSNFVIFDPNDPRARLFGQNNVLVTEFDAFNPITSIFGQAGDIALMFSNTRTISQTSTTADSEREESKITVLASSSPTMVKIKNIRTESDLNANPTEENIEQGSFPLVMLSQTAIKAPQAKLANAETNPNTQKDVNASLIEEEGKDLDKEARIIAVGSSTFITNEGINQGLEHLDMALNMSNYLTQDENFIAIRPKQSQNRQLNVTSEKSQINLMLISFVYPFLFAGFGALIWFRRKSK